MKNRIVIIPLLFAFGISLNSCSSSKEETKAGSHTVEIKAMQFQPSELSVKKGDTVVFINKDIVVHDVTDEKNKAWRSDTLATGQVFNLVVSESADYYCSIHPVMKGRILVK